MTDHMAEAALVAQALGAELVAADRMVEFRWPAQHCNSLMVPDPRGMWPALVALARRVREAEQELSELRQAAEACTAWVDRDELLRRLMALDDVLRGAEQERDELRDCVRGLEEALFLAVGRAPDGSPAVRGTGPSGCMAVEPADHLTRGYAEQKAELDRRFEAARKFAMTLGEPPVPEPAYDPPERCCDGVASVPVREWWDEAGEGLRRAERSF
jgi:hypothetical protein